MSSLRSRKKIFYPQARKATGDNDLLDEALVEHAGAKHLIQEIESMRVGDDLYEAKISVLGEQIKHHVKEEEEELFPEIETLRWMSSLLANKWTRERLNLWSNLELWRKRNSHA